MVNMGNMGNVGNLGSLGGAPVAPDRLELPFIAERTPEPEPRDMGELRVPMPVWPDRGWSPEWRAWVTMARLPLHCLHDIALPDWRAFDADIELSDLAILADDERADAMAEIVAQDRFYTNILAEFSWLMTMTPGAHPRTLALLHLAGLVGLMVSMRLKAEPAPGVPARPRPSQVMPALRPPVPVPGHAAYPSGHAMQASLMALVAEAALPTAAQQAAWRPLLETLAHRIARNREIAGLHYASDSAAGRIAARASFDRLVRMEAFHEMLVAARTEWE